MPIKNIVTGQRVTNAKLERATPALAGGAREELRREMTPAEKLLWKQLRANKLGIHFRRQQVIAGFIVDFYCHKAALVVEVDGDIHDLQQDEDARREKVLREMGLGIFRVRNDEILRDLSAVLKIVREVVFDSLIKQTHEQANEAGLTHGDVGSAVVEARCEG